MDEQNIDPFAGLDDWAKDVERRAKRAHRLRRLGSAASFRRRGPRRRFVRRGGTVMWVAIIVIVLGLLAVLPNLLSRRAYYGGSPGRYPTAHVPVGAYATTTASATASSPFEGTPAVYYPRGDAGIVLPPATALAGFTQDQVDTALQQVRTALVAGRLDHEMLVNHLPAQFVGLLAPNERPQVDKWFTGHQFMTVATWIDPTAKLDPTQLPRVSGRVTVAVAVVDQVPTLQITTNFVWVYAFTGVRDRIAAIHDEVRWDFPAEKKVRPGDAGMWIGTSTSYADRMDCTAFDQGLLAPPKLLDGAPHVHGTEDPNAFLEPDHTLDIVDDCPAPSPSATR